MRQGILAVSVLLCFGAAVAQAAGLHDLRADIAAAKSAGAIRSIRAIERLYAAREYRTAWSRAAMTDLRAAIGRADEHGLTPSDYHLAALGNAIASGKPALADILATDAYLTFASHLLNGRVDPETIEPSWTAARRTGDLIHHLQETLRGGEISRRLEALAPDLPIYHQLRKALQLYRESASANGWPVIPAGPALKLESKGQRVTLLRRRLEMAKLLAASRGRAPDSFDQATSMAVMDFQRRSGLEPDGIVGPDTLRELNRTPDQRVGQLRANLERLRWLPDNLGARHIRVNVADYRLEAWAGGRVVRTHDVIVGRPYRKTPIFSDKISYLVFNPWWFTPRSIARMDKLRDFQADPASVDRLGYEITDRSGQRLDPKTIDWNQYTSGNFPFHVRQRPGPMNALGKVKLMFPNAHNVYLHDTPSQDLFLRVQRVFSSGCVRVSDMLDLAAWALSGTAGWDRARIDTAVVSGRETRVNLATKIPVHFLYLTAVGEDDGSFRFVNDVYDRDPRLIAALDQPPPAKAR